MLFSATLSPDVDVMFLCVGHGDAKKFLAEQALPDHVRIIDLSYDHRLQSPSNGFLYGLPEVYRTTLNNSKQNISNPGCFATAIQLALVPLLSHKILCDDIHCTAITGSTGAGQSLNSAVHFTWRSSNVSVYKAFTHQHIPEVLRTVHEFQPDFDKKFHFVPIRGNFTRGILASVYTRFDGTQKEAEQIYAEYYADHPFVHLVEEQPDLKYVVNTNKCVLHIEVHDGIISIISVIDNLLKGAVGQAVQNMNLVFGLEETEGLYTKGSGF